MTGPEAPEVAARLRQLAARVPTAPVDGTADTAGRVLEVGRHRQQRVVRWVAAGVAVVVLGAAATLARPDVTPVAAAAPTATRTAPTPPEVYEQPPRGSLADDEAFLAQAAVLPWSTPLDPATGGAPEIELDTRRVVYAADVPGGHRWALVMARWRHQWAVTWFSGPRGAAPTELTEAHPAVPWSGRGPLALMDASAPRGPLLVLAEPGAAAEYSPSLDRAPDGRLVRDFDPLPVVDGALLGMVTTPVTWDAGEAYVLRDTARNQVLEVLYTGSPEWMTWYGSLDGPPDEAVLAACLTGLGFDVDDGPGEQDLSYGMTLTEGESSAESAAREKSAADCHVQASRP
ncbi:hypothetical protein O2W14_10520 [Modestobacter sp. VKM Ac-2986]|uniref:hypothetical protein n=1 Tax=Modestobacter sp. VKM Ac-2986 TaxID=3004140 RepID=UPI0022AB4F58|nr:hypothetical protein [Modestobacter sp. VKM Ac-2986]MCZ2829265.1 hypothetical protein [Modestobacter sp. VKM Ac-2986]